MIKNGYLVSWISYLLKLGKLKVLVCCVESTLCQQIQKDLTGCDIDRVTLSDHTQDYKIVLARKEVMKILSSPFFSFIILNYSRLYISILPMSVHSALLLKVCIISCIVTGISLGCVLGEKVLARWYRGYLIIVSYGSIRRAGTGR